MGFILVAGREPHRDILCNLVCDHNVVRSVQRAGGILMGEFG